MTRSNNKEKIEYEWKETELVWKDCESIVGTWIDFDKRQVSLKIATNQKEIIYGLQAPATINWTTFDLSRDNKKVVKLLFDFEKQTMREQLTLQLGS